MMVLFGTHICKKIRINLRRSIGGQQDLWQTTMSDRAASLQFSTSSEPSFVMMYKIVHHLVAVPSTSTLNEVLEEVS